jgi:hypothetical protein
VLVPHQCPSTPSITPPPPLPNLHSLSRATVFPSLPPPPPTLLSIAASVCVYLLGLSGVSALACGMCRLTTSLMPLTFDQSIRFAHADTTSKQDKSVSQGRKRRAEGVVILEEEKSSQS